jgi:alkanesulfonate monooxygenase SsuD/methylene tetrahydromethanopterin reductase-like flavin-dependent oxidoreductase (luciferase family)
MALECGVMFGLRNPEQWQAPSAQLHAETLELIERAEALGFDSAWISEHHFSEDGYCPWPMGVSAAIAARTKRIRIGTDIVVLPLMHPVRLAEEAAVVDVLSGGRFTLGVGAGYRNEEFDLFGVSLRERARRMDDGIALLRRAWRGEALEPHGVRVLPRPVQPAGPPIYVGARAEAATRRAGRLADGLILSRGREQLRWFREAALEAGRDPATLAVATNRIVHVADSAADAMREIGPHLLYHERSYQRWFRKDGLAHEREAPVRYETPEDLPRERYILGPPDEVIAKVRELQRTYGFTELIMWGRLPGLPLDVAQRSLERFGREVLPALQGREATTSEAA